jgi:multicomponent Na+:H+ antiporter subunit E
MKILRIIGFLFYYFGKVIESNISIAVDILTPGFRMSPALVAVPLKSESKGYLLAISNLISMTPGTLSLDFSEDKNELIIHSMYCDDIEEFKRDIDKLQDRVIKLYN